MRTISESLASLKLRQLELSQLYRPEFLRFDEAGAASRFGALLELPGITISDTIHDQLRELMKFRNPSLNLSDAEVEDLIGRHLDGCPMEEYGVWIYFPWSKRVVHTLDEKEFIDVRTSRNLYKITRAERDLLAGKKIGVIGLSVGQSVSVTLAMERVCGEIRLADFDLLELTNLNRIRTGIHNLGLAKVYSVAREIAEIDPFIRVKCFPEGLHETNLDSFFSDGGKLDLLVEESDGFDIKILSRYKARSLGVPVIMEASDRCMVDVERFDLEPDRRILHGIVKNLDVETLKTLKTNEQKIPYMLDILGFEKTTARLRASMVEMKQTVSTWPQLASAVTMGGGITADVSRRILLNHFTESGRYYVDIDELIGNRGQRQQVDGTTPADEALSLQKMRSMVKNADAGEEIDRNDRDAVIEAALSAPSVANRQPWKWLSKGSQLHLFFDRAEAMLFTDPAHIGAYVSLGCAITNAIEMAKHRGYKVRCDLHPAEADPLVATLALERGDPGKTSGLAPFIARRRSAHGAGKGGKLGDDLIRKLALQAKEEDAELQIINDAQRLDRLALLFASCERARLLDPKMHDEYYSRELHLDAENPHRGLPVSTLKLAPAHETILRVLADQKVASLLREWNKGSVIEKFAISMLKGTLGAGIIATKATDHASLLRAGMLAERLWLEAEKNNLSIQPIYLPLAFSTGLSIADAPSDKEFFDFRAVGDQLSALFNGLSGKAVFLFRIFIAESPADPPVRAPLSELFFTC
jgi:tRNA A37 threonylcarbamoyladenosine dehydratase